MEGSTSAVGISSVVDGMTGALQTGANDVMGAIGDILPVVLPIAIAIVVITIGFKVFKKFSNKG